jgi:hypothetical protein
MAARDTVTLTLPPAALEALAHLLANTDLDTPTTQPVLAEGNGRSWINRVQIKHATDGD